MSNRTTDDGRVGAGPVGRAVELRWKHALVAFLLGATTYALYGIAGSWTLDAAVFGLATLTLVVYSTATFKSDMR